MKYYMLFILLFFFLSCEDKKKNEVLSMLHKWSEKEVVFPQNIAFTILGGDTVDFPIPKKYNILTYVDSLGCLSCKLQLNKWKQFINEIETAKEDSVQYYFFFFFNKKVMLNLLKSSSFSYPVCIDEEDRVNKLNNFPKEIAFQTFLLDNNNKIIAMGNPILNPKIKELYLRIIAGKVVRSENESKLINTKVHIEKTSIFLGKFDWKKEGEVTFILQNVGNTPLVIQEVNTSCGCTSVSYSEKPIDVGHRLRLQVTYKAEHPGYFDKTITVYCNVTQSPIKLRINGNAE